MVLDQEIEIKGSKSSFAIIETLNLFHLFWFGRLIIARIQYVLL